MPLGLLFWIIVLIYVLLGAFSRFGPAPGPYWGYGGWFLEIILIVILGWQVFGAAIK
jgi:hypothetical protein